MVKRLWGVYLGGLVALNGAVLYSATQAAERPPTFKGYQCTQDCSGHRAGYAWAARNGVTQRSQCRGSSQSFVEGCWAWVEGR